MLDFIRNRMFYIEHCRVVRLTILLLIGFAFNFGMVSKALALNLSIGKKSDATQVEFQGKAFWDYWLEQKEAKLYFKIDPLPQKQLQKLKDYKDDLVTKVEVVSEDDKQIELRFHLKDSQVETFAYQMESPSRLLIDIYRNPNAKKVKKKTAKKKVAKRKPASEMPILVEEQEKPAKIPEPKEIPGIFDGADPNYELQTNALIKNSPLDSTRQSNRDWGNKHRVSWPGILQPCFREGVPAVIICLNVLRY